MGPSYLHRLPGVPRHAPGQAPAGLGSAGGAFSWILRLGIGIIFIYHGAAKLFLTPTAMAAFFASIGLPGPFSLVVGAVELLGGLALITGIGMRIAAIALSVILLGATFTAKWALGFVTPEGMPGWEFDFALLAGTLSLAFSGVGAVERAPANASTAPGGEAAAPGGVTTAAWDEAAAPGSATPAARDEAAAPGSATTAARDEATPPMGEAPSAAAAAVRSGVSGANLPNAPRIAELAPEEAIAQNPAWKAFHEQTKDVPTAQFSDLEWADGIILGSPTRFGTIASQMKQFIDTAGGLWAQGKLANKVAAGFVTASNPHGGQEATILALYTTLYHWGSIVVAPGYTHDVVFQAGGNPYGASALGTDTGPVEAELAGARHLGSRVAAIASRVLAGRAVPV